MCASRAKKKFGRNLQGKVVSAPQAEQKSQIFEDIFGQIFARDRGRFTLTHSLGVTPANIRINFTSRETRMIVLPDTEDRTIVSLFVWTKHRNVTDGRTDRQTDRSAVAITPATYFLRPRLVERSSREVELCI